MVLYRHELRQGRFSLILWSAVISFMLGVCVIIYPEMSTQMSEMTDMFANMGSFSSAFGLDQLNFGEFTGYFGIEIGNTLGLGGAFFAAISGITALAKEEKEHTAEFLFAHPISRARALTEKLAALLTRILILNLAVCGITVLACCAIGETAAMGTVLLLFLANLLLQIEIGALSFGISAFVTGGSVGIGIGLAVLFYFCNLLANLTEDLSLLKYLTPFAYTDGAHIVTESAPKWEYLLPGAVLTALGICAAYLRYRKKDLQ